MHLTKYILSISVFFLCLIALGSIEIHFNAELISPVFIELVYNKRNGTRATPNLYTHNWEIAFRESIYIYYMRSVASNFSSIMATI